MVYVNRNSIRVLLWGVGLFAAIAGNLPLVVLVATALITSHIQELRETVGSRR